MSELLILQIFLQNIRKYIQQAKSFPPWCHSISCVAKTSVSNPLKALQIQTDWTFWKQQTSLFQQVIMTPDNFSSGMLDY